MATLDGSKVLEYLKAKRLEYLAQAKNMRNDGRDEAARLFEAKAISVAVIYLDVCEMGGVEKQ